MKCRFCQNYMSELDTCKFCHFEKDESYNPFIKDDWDILDLDEEDGWEHIQILDRLRFKGVDCYSADIWFNNDMALLIGCKGSLDEIAKVLNVHREVLYATDGEFVIVNLYQEKHLRKEPKSCESCRHFIDSMFGDCKLGNLDDDKLVDEDGVLRVDCNEWEKKE